jgi:DNA topoisomerase-1
MADTPQPLKQARTASEIIDRGARARWWRRRGSKRGFWYEDVNGKRITDKEQIERIKALVVPPAWTNVRIAPSPRNRLQAVGIDVAGRVQYLYHSQYAARQQRRKFEKVERFGKHLPALRIRTNEDIAQEGLTRERVLAVIIRLINELYFRVGSEDSVKRYRTFGVTTLRNRHLEIKRDGSLTFNFKGKHHVQHRRVIVDKELASLMHDIKSMRGAKLFAYRDEEGRIRPIKPKDVNDYIKSATAPEFSAKDFRTWGGTLLAAVELAEMGLSEDEKQAKSQIAKAVKRVAERLGNTPAVCRSSYIHPIVLELYKKGTTLEEFRRKVERYIQKIEPEYEPEEKALITMLGKQSS